jgi:transcriptional antiterminator Rof (Rho-off)
MTRAKIDLSWRDEAGAPHQARVLPIDVVTRDKAEYLIVRDQSGAELTLRLDLIDEAINLATGSKLV